MIKEYIFKKLLDAAYERAKGILKESAGKLLTPAEKIEESIRYHLEAVETWSGEISFNELKKARYLSKVFIELDLFLYPRRIRQPNEAIESIPLKSIFDYSHGHPILLGQPGAGKTTSMKYLSQLLLHDANYQRERLSLPILIKLRELHGGAGGDDSIIIEQLYEILGLSFTLPKHSPTEEFLIESKKIKEKLVINVLEELKVLLLLDGFDEIAQKSNRDEALREIRKLAIHLKKSVLVLTSRSGDFVYNIDNTTQYEISPLKTEQINQFALKWLQKEELASDFLGKINTSPFADTTIRPLTLAHLCAIYERIGKIPEKPKSIYKRIIHLLLEEWDQQRSVKRHSRYANFEIDRKFDFLCRIAYVLTTSFQATVFSEENLESTYFNIYRDYDLVAHEVHQVVAELETHTGLFLQASYRHYEFAHKSLQEYLTAEYLVKLPIIPPQVDVLNKLPNELAIAVTISSDPSGYFSELVLNRLSQMKLSEAYIKAFMNRLVLEKPDFNTGANVSLALVILYSTYVRQHLSDLDILYSDTVMIEFEVLMKQAFGLNPSLPLLNYYDTEKIHEEEKDGILLLRKKDIFSTAIGERVEKYPSELYMKESFLANWREDNA